MPEKSISFITFFSKLINDLTAFHNQLCFVSFFISFNIENDFLLYSLLQKCINKS